MLYIEDARAIAQYILENSVHWEDHSNEGEASCQGWVCRMCRHLTAKPGDRQHSDGCLYYKAARLYASLEPEALRTYLLELCADDVGHTI
jgi:hypothetical protein